MTNQIPTLDRPEKDKGVVRPINPRWYKRLACKAIGHKVNEGRYIDSHGNDDALSFCERCGELDV